MSFWPESQAYVREEESQAEVTDCACPYLTVGVAVPVAARAFVRGIEGPDRRCTVTHRRGHAVGICLVRVQADVPAVSARRLAMLNSHFVPAIVAADDSRAEHRSATTSNLSEKVNQAPECVYCLLADSAVPSLQPMSS